MDDKNSRLSAVLDLKRSQDLPMAVAAVVEAQWPGAEPAQRPKTHI
jgi:hypothetical protein